MTLINELALFFFGSFISLFSIVDPLLAVPVFASLTENYTHDHRVDTARRASLYVVGVLLLFFVTGGLLLQFFGISIECLRIGGGLMIVGSAVEMLQKKERLQPEEHRESFEKEDIAFSPLAMPLLSGPGSIAVIIGMTTEAKSWLYYPIILITILLIGVSCFVMMRLANRISRTMGQTMMKSFTRIMGFLLLCVGVQSIINGIMPLLRQGYH